MVQQIILVSFVAIALFLTGFFFGRKGKTQLERELEATRTRLSSSEALSKELKRLLYGHKREVSS